MRRKARRHTYRRSPLSRFEVLEGRRMLATDLGQIAGTVVNDLDNGPGADVVAVGQELELFLDDGMTPGVFDVDDTSQGTTVTDGSGNYSFDNLVAGTYFVRINPSAGTQTRPNENVSAPITFSALQAMGTTSITIDDFTATQDITATAPGTPTNSGTVDDPGIQGGEQDLFVEVTAGAGDVRARSGFNNGTSVVLNLSSDSGVNGRLVAAWDGNDNDATTLAQGLSLDLLQGGDNTAFALNLAADQTAGTLLLRVHSGAGNVSTATIELDNIDGGVNDGVTDDVDTDGVINGTPQEQISVNFADFVTTAGTGADFSNATAIELELDFTGAGENGLDAEVEVLGVVGFTTLAADFTVLNELTLGDQVFLDLDNDGVFEPGETGIAGVAVTLFEDSNGDDSIAGENQVATTTTDANGLYTFTGLLPGDYLVQIDASNFTTGQPLDGLATSTGNDPAPDPDVTANNTDKGIEQLDGSVLALGVTLVGDGEPDAGADGDNDANTNLTLDFGFFGFDLVIDKTVDQTTASPNDALVYTILVTNNGPTNATGVTLTDTLPTGVTFVSASSTQGSATGLAGNPLVAANIGTLLPGASATITINATIDPAATGDLINSAVVAATDESNTTNNTATATTTIDPVIDLAITKVDDDGDLPVTEGQTITYTITATNNGPSDATGVVVTDVLPTGLTLVSTSIVPTTDNPVAGGRELTFALGALAGGVSAPAITITATVDPGQVAVLTNNATIAGTETESTLANNSASASSTPAPPALGAINGQVFIDADEDNVRDPGELPIQGVFLSLFNGAGALVATTVTDANGQYQFNNLLPDTYRVVQTQPTLFPDLAESSDTPGAVVGAVNDEISNLVVNGNTAVANDFAEGVPVFGKRSFFFSSGLFN